MPGPVCGTVLVVLGGVQRPHWDTSSPSQYCCVITLYLHYCCLSFNPSGSLLQGQFIASLVAGDVYTFC